MDIENISKQLENGVNQGVIAPTDQELLPKGILDISQFPITAPDSNQDKYFSDFDNQFANTFDTLGCNIFSSVAGVEMYLNALGGDPDYDSEEMGKVELSERKACVDAGLNGSVGSSEQMWEDMINSYGLIRWNDWAWTDDITRKEFFGTETPAMEAQGLKFLQKYAPFHRQVGTDHASITEALKYGPVKIFVGTGPGWNVGEPSVVPKTLNPMNHAVLARKIDNLGVHIRDQYPPYLKVLAPDYIIYYAYQTLIKKVPQFKHKFTKDLWYNLIDPENINLQTALKINGVFPQDFPYNERFGEMTLYAVKAFQRKYGIANAGTPGYGRCGPLTRAKLNSLYNV